MADFTQGQGQILDWTLLDDTASDNPSATTGEKTDLATNINNELRITVAHADANDAASNFVSVVVSTKSGSNNEAWRENAPLSAGGGQALTEALNAASGASEVNPERLQVADTTDWDDGAAHWLFLKDNGTLVDSALVLVGGGWSDNDYYINQWDLIRDYDASDALFDGVDIIKVTLPAGTAAFRVDFFNADGDATYAVRVDYESATDIA
jgi:hypothetical protein